MSQVEICLGRNIFIPIQILSFDIIFHYLYSCRHMIRSISEVSKKFNWPCPNLRNADLPSLKSGQIRFLVQKDAQCSEAHTFFSSDFCYFNFFQMVDLNHFFHYIFFKLSFALMIRSWNAFCNRNLTRFFSYPTNMASVPSLLRIRHPTSCT